MNTVRLDENVIPMVEYFNAKGLETVMSCEGHNSTNMSMFWVRFGESVTKENIFEFMRAHLVKGWYRGCGRFVERYITGEHTVITNLEYQAATIDAANADLKMWKELDLVSSLARNAEKLIAEENS